MGCSVRKDTWGEKNCIASPFWREYWVKKCQTVKRTQGQSTGKNQTLNSLDVMQIYIKMEMLGETGTEMGTQFPNKVVEI